MKEYLKENPRKNIRKKIREKYSKDNPQKEIRRKIRERIFERKYPFEKKTGVLKLSLLSRKSAR